MLTSTTTPSIPAMIPSCYIPSTSYFSPSTMTMMRAGGGSTKGGILSSSTASLQRYERRRRNRGGISAFMPSNDERAKKDMTRMSFWGQGKQEEEKPVLKVKEEEMNEDELEAKRIQEILDKQLVLAGDAMAEDVLPYLGLILIQALPILAAGFVGTNFGFFWTTAVLAVYLGAKRSSATAKAGEIFQKIDTRNALAAPFAASVSLFGTYYLLKNFQLDIATIYQAMTTSFGWFCLRDVLASALLGLGLFPPASSSALLDSKNPALAAGPEKGELFPVKVVAGLTSAVICATYLWAPAATNGAPLAAAAAVLAANVITSGIALHAQGTIPLKSVKPALIFLTGLFLYDIYWVFYSPGSVMETVATAGLFVGLMKQIDDQAKQEDPSLKTSFFSFGLSGYAIGLLLTFAANVLSQRGQPALLYINPSLILSALLAAGVSGQFDRLWKHGEKAIGEEGPI